MPLANDALARRLDDVAALLEEQRANPFRVRAYRNAADALRQLDSPVASIYRDQGIAGLEELPGIGESIARSLRALLTTGRLPMLERLRGASDPEELLMSVPGIGRKTAERLHEELGIDSLEALELAAHDGRLAALPGIGSKRLLGIRDLLAARLGRLRPVGSERSAAPEPDVAELLDVDREYRQRTAQGSLHKIAPKRMNPDMAAWLPVLHTERAGRHYTALFSNTPRAHRLNRTHDWVVIYCDAGDGERQYTVVTSTHGHMEGRRVVRGREVDCAQHYGLPAMT
ncbi:MAG TPA: helix-hairpin-helix domain-containing protein [Trueperaceae bacterium]|nr:helix-hairpin-helix domain-containing protein [Trueperaceae bacterium]